MRAKKVLRLANALSGERHARALARQGRIGSIVAGQRAQTVLHIAGDEVTHAD